LAEIRLSLKASESLQPTACKLVSQVATKFGEQINSAAKYGQIFFLSLIPLAGDIVLPCCFKANLKLIMCLDCSHRSEVKMSCVKCVGEEY